MAVEIVEAADAVEAEEPEESGEDSVCSECGHVMGDGVDTCPNCGRPVLPAEEIPEPSEEDLDLSDLAEDAENPVWDAAFQGGDAVASPGVDRPVGQNGRFFQGSLILNIYSGVVSGLVCFVVALAFALLATSQPGVREFLPQVLAMALTASVVGGFVYASRAGIPFALAGPEAVISAVLFLFLGSIQRSMEGLYPEGHLFATMVAGLTVAALCAGLALYLMGRFRVGEMVRYIPVQIIGGVIGGVGIFVLLGALDSMSGLDIDWTSPVSAFVNSMMHLKLSYFLFSMGPGVVFGLLVFLCLGRSGNSLLVLLLIVAGAAAGFSAGIWGETEDVRSLAAVLPLPEGASVRSVLLGVDANFLDSIQWGVLKSNSPYLGAISILAVLTTMYRITKLEMLQEREIDLSREYSSLGLANLFSGLTGGGPVSLLYSQSAGNYLVGARGAVSGLVAAFVCGALFWFADDILLYLPRFVPEGFIVYIGLEILRNWLFQTRSAFTRSDDTAMLWITFLFTVFFGILEGIGFGIALAMLATVRRYSRGGVVRNVLSGVNHHSNVDRAPAQQRILAEYGDHIFILRLQGFLFLGSMQRLLQDIGSRLENRNLLPVEYLILDFRLVTGLASAAGIGFAKLRTLAETFGFEVIITSAPLELEEHLEKSGYTGDEGGFKVFHNLDFAMEWCENEVLDRENLRDMQHLSLTKLLEPVFPEPRYIPVLMKLLRKEYVKKGDVVFRQGDASDAMYFVESGRLDVELELEGGKILRIKKVGPGAVFGEMGIYTDAPRSATIRAAEKCVVYKMTREKLDAVEKRAPVLVTSINRFLVNMLSERLGAANIKIRDLMV
ncbi:SulP family inorganic anion transporter [Pseudodesulfovibrio tunisiensis]|uniref:SulP family inorganic anion transporter n=1 Tax=Pseudodesulfovibrio tunisiensis TaxID=463192 RepID=UPI001FB4F461|nr:SulP family inorganic anion transporter [Pseudodesulfovibrio tunisiensis]